MDNAEMTYADGRLTLSFERARGTGDSDDVSFADNCYYFLFPVGGGPLTSDGFSQHSDVPQISAERICIGKTRTTRCFDLLGVYCK